MISSSRPRRTSVTNTNDVETVKPRAKKMIAGGAKALDGKASRKSSENGTKEKKESKKKKKKEESSTGCSYNDDSHSGPADPLSQLHQSYGSLGGSQGALNCNEDCFSTPKQQSPWQDKLKKNSAGFKSGIAAPPIVNSGGSPTITYSKSHLKPVKEHTPKHSSHHDYLDPNHNSILSEFSTPKQSPWKSPSKKRVTMPKDKNGASPPIFRDDDPSGTSYTSYSESQSNNNAEGTREVGLSKEQRKELKRLKKAKKLAKKEKAAAAAAASSEPVPFQQSPRRASLSGNAPPPNSILKSPVRPKKAKTKKKGVKFAGAVSRTYGPKHAAAASRIAALARGKRARRLLHLRKLQDRLDNQEALVAYQLKQIKKETAAAKKEFKQRAKDRFHKNLERKGAPDAMIDDAHNIVATIRKENTEVRARNQRLYQDIENLKTNNARLEASNESGGEFYDRLKYHDDTCIAENAKLTKIAASYKKAVHEHKEHLEMHISYGDAEHKIKTIYATLLANVLTMMDGCSNKDLVADIHAIANELEQTHGAAATKSK